jgi:hypothetical protein
VWKARVKVVRGIPVLCSEERRPYLEYFESPAEAIDDYFMQGGGTREELRAHTKEELS